MKQSAVAGALLALFSSYAGAQSVTIYGILDTGIERISKVATPSGDESLVRMNTGGTAPPIWGFRGTEDLDNGLKASFNLEGDYDSSTGGSRFSALGIFGRQANVSLSGGFGTVTLGRVYTPAILTELATDPRGYKESYSNLYLLALNQAPTGNAQTGNHFLGLFIGNSIGYSNTVGPVTLRVTYGFGEQAGSISNGSTTSMGLAYAGPITATLTYQKVKGTGEAENSRVGVGLAVPLGDFAVKALVARAEGDDTAGVREFKTDTYAVGADYKWNQQNTANVSYYYGKDKLAGGGNSKGLVVSNDYALSKRTVIYAQAVFLDVSDTASVRTQITGGLTPNGEKASILGAGIRHAF